LYWSDTGKASILGLGGIIALGIGFLRRKLFFGQIFTGIHRNAEAWVWACGRRFFADDEQPAAEEEAKTQGKSEIFCEDMKYLKKSAFRRMR
jgi:hypothetical protein